MNLIRYVLIATVLLAAYVVVAVFIMFPLFGAAMAAIIFLTAFRKTHHHTAHGTARFANAGDIKHLTEGEGIVLGHIADKPGKIAGVKMLFNFHQLASYAVRHFLESCQRKQQRRLVRLTNAIHTAVFAPSGAGKNVSIVEPFLLSSSENMFVIDIKGENARITADFRARVFGHKIVLLDPFKIVTKKNSATWNVLDLIDPGGPECIDQARAIAEALVAKEPNNRDPHWTQKAEVFIAGIIVAVLEFLPPDKRSLQEVASILADRELFRQAVDRMRVSTAHGGLIARLGGEMAMPSDKELDGILSTANRSLAFLSTPAVVESTRTTSGFNPSDLDGNVTCYMIIPAQFLRSHAGLLKLWCSALMQMVVSRGVNRPKPLNMVLDECSQVGCPEAIADMLTIGRGYGLKLTLIFQSMAQLKKMFPDGQEGVLLSNTSQIFFAVNDKETADYVSARLGEYTQIVTSGGWGSGTSHSTTKDGGTHGYSGNRNHNWNQAARRLLQPSEVERLDPRIAVCFHAGCPPIATYLTRYYENDFYPDQGMGFGKVVFDTACLLLAVGMIAVIVTAALVKPN